MYEIPQILRLCKGLSTGHCRVPCGGHSGSHVDMRMCTNAALLWHAVAVLCHPIPLHSNCCHCLHGSARHPTYVPSKWSCSCTDVCLHHPCTFDHLMFIPVGDHKQSMAAAVGGSCACHDLAVPATVSGSQFVLINFATDSESMPIVSSVFGWCRLAIFCPAVFVGTAGLQPMHGLCGHHMPTMCVLVPSSRAIRSCCVCAETQTVL